MTPYRIEGKIDTKVDQESLVVQQIQKALSAKGGADADYLCTYGDDAAGDLAIKVERGSDLQMIVIEVHSWPAGIYDRILQELAI